MDVTLPSLLVFGPQDENVSERVHQDLHRELNRSTRLSALRKAVDSLPRFWETLVDFDPSLRQVPGANYLGQLRQWLHSAGPIPHSQTSLPNHYALALSVLLQITQYTRYLDYLGDGAHRNLQNSVKVGGLQGFCVGILSAIAVAVSRDEADLGASAATALRLAVCIGAYVDLDGASSSIATKYRAIALMWREGNTEDKAVVTAVINSTPNVSETFVAPPAPKLTIFSIRHIFPV